MKHALLIGGPPGSGKTTVASRIARRHGLRLYSADTMTWIHRDQALAAGCRAAEQWEGMSPDERWTQSTEEMVAMALHYERGEMVVDDLMALPTTPLVVAEGSTVPTSAVADGLIDRAATIWLLPTREFQDGRLAVSDLADGQTRLYRKLRGVIEADVQRFDLPALTVDGSKGVEEMIENVERRFADMIEAGPCAATLLERQDLLRGSNLALVGQIRGYYERTWAVGDGDSAVRAFACECGDAVCHANVSAPVRNVAAYPVFAMGHGRV